MLPQPTKALARGAFLGTRDPFRTTSELPQSPESNHNPFVGMPTEKWMDEHPSFPCSSKASQCLLFKSQKKPQAPPTPFHAHLMHLIHSSFSSGVGAEMRYTVWFPSTTRPSASVLQALITWSLLSGIYSSKQFCKRRKVGRIGGHHGFQTLQIS